MVSSARRQLLRSTLIAKLLPLVLIIPLFWRLQTFDILPAFTFDVTQFAYLLALSVAVLASVLEYDAAKGGKKGFFKSLHIGTAIAFLAVLAGIGLIIFVLGTNYDYTDPTINQIITYYFIVIILILGIQGIREISDKTYATRRNKEKTIKF